MGEFFSLLSAFFWACAVIIFKQIGDRVPPILLNAIKNTLGFILLFLTIILLGANPLNIPSAITNDDIIILFVSGILGLGIADILFLHSLNIVGAGISALVDIMYSPFVILFAFFLLGEKLVEIQIIGGILIIGSIIFASLKLRNIPVDRNRLRFGIFIGVVALALMAYCIVWIKPILNRMNGVNNQLWIAGFRMVPGAITPIIISLFVIPKSKIIKVLSNKFVWKPLLLGTIFSTYLGISFWIIGMSLTKASIAAILNQTASFFILILARIFLNELITPRKTIAIIIASGGAILILLGAN
jgi:drug/metabolite transporter (DMT)-like permease